MVLIDATYIHESGGKTLLEYFVSGVLDQKYNFILLLDKRLDAEFVIRVPPNKIFWVNSSEKDRFLIYNKLKKQITSVFCFANVPPPIFLPKIKVFILFHNSLILSSIFETNSHSFKSKLFFIIRRQYIKFLNCENYKWIVQTDIMNISLTNALNITPSSVLTLPFYSKGLAKSKKEKSMTNPRFLYVADGVPQKNHLKLFEAWRILFFKYNLSFELSVTLPKRFVNLHRYISELVNEGIPIKNYGRCDKQLLSTLYSDINYFIFPSLSESFGLPLLEAAEAGCQILASDLPYVYEVIKPSATFDPNCADDIAKAIFMLSRNIDLPATEVVINDKRDKIINLLFN